MIEPLAAIALAFVTAVVVTRAVELVARRLQLLDVPNERSSHVQPTPRVGGIGIIAGVIVGAVLLWPFDDGPAIAVVVAVSVALGAVGLIDDVRGTSVLAKYLSQLVAAVVVAVAIAPSLRLEAFGLDVVVDGAAAVVLTVIGLTALINAWNFMDGTDGLIGSVAAATAVMGIALVTPSAAAMLAVAAAAALGFLVWNTAPASVFMGDVGSQALGLLLGGLLLIGPSGTADVVPLLILASPLLFDTGFTLIRRARAGRDLFAGHREHLYQRAVIAGRSHREVAAGHAVAVVITGLIAIAWSVAGAPGQVALSLLLAVAAVAYWRWVRRLEAAAGPPQV